MDSERMNDILAAVVYCNARLLNRNASAMQALGRIYFPTGTRLMSDHMRRCQSGSIRSAARR